MMLFVVDPMTARVVAGPDCRPQFRPGEIEAAAAQHPDCLPFVRADLPTWPDSLDAWLATVDEVQPEGPEGEEPPPPYLVVRAVEPDPAWRPPAPTPEEMIASWLRGL